MNRPWPSLGVGWVIAVVVLILSIIEGAGAVDMPDWLLIAALALAMLL